MTGEPYAGDPHVRFGRRGGSARSFPYPYPGLRCCLGGARSELRWQVGGPREVSPHSGGEVLPHGRMKGKGCQAGAWRSQGGARSELRLEEGDLFLRR